jgi:hypothetical protein
MASATPPLRDALFTGPGLALLGRHFFEAWLGSAGYCLTCHFTPHANGRIWPGIARHLEVSVR